MIAKKIAADISATANISAGARLLRQRTTGNVEKGRESFYHRGIKSLSACILHQGEFKGNPTFKFVCWILDRRDNKVKLHFMPPTIMRALGDLQMDDDYAFEEVPMPLT